MLDAREKIDKTIKKKNTHGARFYAGVCIPFMKQHQILMANEHKHHSHITLKKLLVQIILKPAFKDIST